MVLFLLHGWETKAEQFSLKSNMLFVAEQRASQVPSLKPGTKTSKQLFSLQYACMKIPEAITGLDPIFDGGGKKKKRKGERIIIYLNIQLKNCKELDSELSLILLGNLITECCILVFLEAHFMNTRENQSRI